LQTLSIGFGFQPHLNLCVWLFAYDSIDIKKFNGNGLQGGNRNWT